MDDQDSDLVSTTPSMPGAKRRHPRPLLDLGIACKLKTMRKNGAAEFLLRPGVGIRLCRFFARRTVCRPRLLGPVSICD